jgi:hypothetical protein
MRMRVLALCRMSLAFRELARIVEYRRPCLATTA